jgi:hypothetical protein
VLFNFRHFLQHSRFDSGKITRLNHFGGWFVPLNLGRELILCSVDTSIQNTKKFNKKIIEYSQTICIFSAAFRALQGLQLREIERSTHFGVSLWQGLDEICQQLGESS